jgi:hypothetical protein
MQVSVTKLNRFLVYSKVEKAQYWLEYYDVDPDDLAGFQVATKAKVRSGNFDWRPWNPSCIGSIKVTIKDYGWRKFSYNDWNAAGAFLSSEKRPDLALELLSGAEKLAMNGYTRTPLIEAVAALEVALNRFLQSPLDEVNQTLLRDVEQKSIYKLGQKLGLRGQLAILLPLILTPEQLPRDILNLSREAVDRRGIVVHQGTREVNPEELARFLFSLRKLTMLLLDLTA